MIQCFRCLKEFKYQCELSRHNNRKYPCKPREGPLYTPLNPPHTPLSPPYTPLIPLYTPLLQEKYNPEDYPKECRYCKYEFTEAFNARRHEQDCKEKDQLRKLEIKLCIPMDKYHEKDCRFCNKVLSRREHLQRHQKSCKARYKYMEALRDRHSAEHCKTVNHVTTIHNNNSNNSINDNRQYNVIVNSVDNTERIMRNLPEKVAQWLIHDQRQSSGKHMDWRTGMKMILKTHEKPENNNLKVTSDRSSVIWCYDGDQHVPKVANMVIEEEFQQCVDDLLHIQDKHHKVLCKLGALREMESYLETIASQDHAKNHKKSVMAALCCLSKSNE